MEDENTKNDQLYLEPKIYEKLTVIESILIGACIALFVGGIWVAFYIFDNFGFHNDTTSLFGFIVSPPKEILFILKNSDEIMFVIVSRFLLAFGVLWAPISWIVFKLRE